MENTAKLLERTDTVREKYDNIATDLGSRMRETAPNTLKALRLAHKDTIVATMYDGPAMLRQMEADAQAKLVAKNDETHVIAKQKYDEWRARRPPPPQRRPPA